MKFSTIHHPLSDGDDDYSGGVMVMESGDAVIAVANMAVDGGTVVVDVAIMVVEMVNRDKVVVDVVVAVVPQK